ncbi:MAG: HAMP domain-containing sensor histidine kinase, partial [Granulosicoccus sp.]
NEMADDTSAILSRRITTFESEIDPLEFSLLDSGHFVAYRTVWRDGQRLIQGMLIDQQRFVEALVRQPFQATGLFAMSELSVVYQSELLATYRRSDSALYSRGTPAMEGTLLYRNRLADPLNAMELVFSIKRLPPGPGAKVLAWVTLALATVFCGGFYLLYRTGRKQIALAAQQQDFVSAVSHELKTPLTSIRLYGEMLREGWADDSKKQQYYEFIHNESERLGRLIDNVLQLARINRNELPIDLHRISVRQLMQSMESRLEQYPGRMIHELVFTVEPASSDIAINVDEDSFSQIMINLIDNALKFTEKSDNKKIEISSRLSANDRIQFSVRDYGPGISKGQLKKIFRMFYRSESELTRETVGTGIGLAIVHQLCQVMQAEVDVLNCNPGAEFRVVFSVAE